MEYLFGWVIFCVAAASVAKSKRRNVYLWAVLGILLGPFAILIVALLEPVPSVSSDSEQCTENE